ncbi:ComEC/Rec2 family competence protein [Sphingomonas endophytica]|uniref:Competence protein ComEC n=1 Tax=Sphingomonas endophytica TaxID=869719 RepID=A0ABR6N2E2_9SPHN|nr:ComEC/Rec2 family competence protein [Sphingomonas endophytica]MBB5724957.1 competence protein ComEC [Sphingomonas endophytica]
MIQDALEQRLEAERDQLVLWVPVALGAGAAAWFVLPDPRAWAASLLLALATALAALVVARGGRAPVLVAVLSLAVAIGLALTWARAERVAAPVLARPTIAWVTGRVEQVEPLPARRLTRVTLAVQAWDGEGSAPARVRINLDARTAPPGLARGAMIRVRARLMPPAPPAVPGAYDFARVAWFAGLGATGRGFAPVQVVMPAAAGATDVRAALTRHIEVRLAGSAGGIAAALATGDTGAIDETDAEAMRRAGLAHLLSVSGLHITAAVGLVMWLTLRLLALSPRLALTGQLPLIAAAAGAVAAIGYTWLTGAQVPTIRSCVAALMVLVALVLGREALTLRLVAAGAVVVLLCWPESVVGPSFQLSFAAVTAIIAFHEHPRVRSWFGAHEEPRWRAVLRGAASLLLTGLLVELTLMPIAVYHFHQAGFYGAVANIVAIPLTTFVVMPAEAVALLLDPVGAGAPAWWVADRALALLLWIARTVAAAPGAVTALPVMPLAAFGAMVAGGLWLAIWRTRWRYAGLVPVAIGAVWTIATPVPDLIVTGDGRHLALRGDDGGVAILRDRTGDYVRDLLAEAGGLDGVPELLSETRGARCNRDLCWMVRRVDGRVWRVLATRSLYLVPANELILLCRQADVVVSERRLPRGCQGRWLTLDRATLATTGGVRVTFATGRVATVRTAGDAHPWMLPGARDGVGRSPMLAGWLSMLPGMDLEAKRP